MNLFGRNDGDMQITEAELNAMTGELDMLHNETFPGVRTTLDEFSANVARDQGKGLDVSGGFGRRGFLAGLGGVTLLGALAACGSSGDDDAKSSAPKTKAAPKSSAAAASKYTGDLKVVALAAALENLAVAAYGMALTAAGKGTLGKVPAAIGVFATTAQKQHKDHASAWNGVLTKANLPAITGTPLTIAADQVKQLKAAKSVADVAKLALALEDAAAQTYLFAAANVKDSGGIMTAATIEPVEQMHAAILHFVLGQYPVPQTFLGIENAVKPDALTA